MHGDQADFTALLRDIRDAAGSMHVPRRHVLEVIGGRMAAVLRMEA